MSVYPRERPAHQWGEKMLPALHCLRIQPGPNGDPGPPRHGPSVGGLLNCMYNYVSDPNGADVISAIRSASYVDQIGEVRIFAISAWPYPHSPQGTTMAHVIIDGRAVIAWSNEYLTYGRPALNLMAEDGKDWVHFKSGQVDFASSSITFVRSSIKPTHRRAPPPERGLMETAPDDGADLISAISLSPVSKLG